MDGWIDGQIDGDYIVEKEIKIQTVSRWMG